MKCNGCCFIHQILSNLLFSISTLSQFCRLFLLIQPAQFVSRLLLSYQELFPIVSSPSNSPTRFFLSALQSIHILPPTQCGILSLGRCHLFLLSPTPVLVSRYIIPLRLTLLLAFSSSLAVTALLFLLTFDPS